jgi:hypothetical protein
MKCVYCDRELEEGGPKVTLTGIRAIAGDTCCLENDMVIPYHRECFFKLPPALREPWIQKWDGGKPDH